MRAIDIEWEGPFSVPYCREEDRYHPPSLPHDLEQGAQIYAVYGRHPVYGPNILLYIGQTQSSNTGRSVRQRLREHLDGRFWFQKELFIHAGVVSEASVSVGDPDLIRGVESLLIAVHLPALNVEYMKGPSRNARQLHIVNWGVPGSVMPECSSRYFIGFEND